ncbi:uncharacterized protein LOC131853573 isoform X3 [Achroia grisella]|uniref:uncharacterized protein LOC131853573 isoform X3 n=1 Tax=Achroia grisella TaxID=688607 RepID=UPI0027D2491B|nr:uncharacterized protein LOC131853573 isoform X3 [Achroia grisella]
MALNNLNNYIAYTFQNTSHNILVVYLSPIIQVVFNLDITIYAQPFTRCLRNMQTDMDKQYGGVSVILLFCFPCNLNQSDIMIYLALFFRG